MGETVLVSGGRSGAIVMTAKDAGERTAAAARVLAEYVRKSTGVELPVYIGGDVADHDHDTGDVIPIRIGIRGEEGGPLEPLLRDLDEDGFVIRTANGEIDIAGPSSWGTMYGVYEFLERYVGVRWLLPGEFGEDVPVYSDLSVPEETVREQPAFLSRDLNDFPAAADWMRFNRLRRRMNPFHNLCNLLPPSRYKDTHPEFYKAGAKLDRDTDWQPAFTNRGTAEEALVRSPDVTPVSSPTGRGVVLSGIGTAWMAEELPFAPGTYGVAVHYKARIEAALTAMIQLQYKLYVAEDRPVAFLRSEDRVFVRSTAGEWATLHFIADIPAQAKGVPVKPGRDPYLSERICRK